jgi:hypothetical protein
MSHFTLLRVRLSDRTPLLKALADLGHAVQPGPIRVRGYQGNSVEADFKITPNNGGFDIGFRQREDGYELVADWWGIRGLRQEVFVQQLRQRYAYHSACEALTAEGFALVEEETRADGTLRLVLRRAV